MKTLVCLLLIVYYARDSAITIVQSLAKCLGYFHMQLALLLAIHLLACLCLHLKQEEILSFLSWSSHIYFVFLITFVLAAFLASEILVATFTIATPSVGLCNCLI